MFDDPAVFLMSSRQKTGHVFIDDERDVEGITEPNEPGPFDGSIDIETSGHDTGLIGHDADGHAVQPTITDHDVFRPVLVDFEEISVVHIGSNDAANVVGLIGIGWNDIPQGFVLAHGIVLGGRPGWIFHIVLGQKRHQFADHLETGTVVGCRKMGHAALGIVGHGAAEVFLADSFTGDRFDDFGTGDKHVAGFFDHENPVGQRRAVHRTAC